MTTKITRRGAIVALAGAGAAMLAGKAAAAAPQESAPGREHAVVPLPFNPASLKGLSEKLLVSHHDNNYAGAVKNLNKVEAELRGVTKDTPVYLVAALKERELLYRNSKVLHELYFSNLGEAGAAGDAFKKAVEATWSTSGRFEEVFRATGLALGGGSGWVVLGQDLREEGLVIAASANHTQSLASSVPLLVMDMYEHAYAIDYGAAAARYVEAFFANIAWHEVGKRFDRAAGALAALRR